MATTASPRQPWKTARRKATSDGQHHRRPADHGPSAVRHRRLRRRRQVHPHRAAAARLQVDLRGPARGRGDHQPRQGLRLHRPRAAHRRAPLRARAGHHDRRGLPLLRDPGPQVHHRGHPRPRAVHPQHGHRRLDRRPRPRPRRRAPGPDRAVAPARRDPVAAPGPAPGAGREQDGPRGLLGGDLQQDPPGVHAVRDEAQHPGPRGHPDLGAPGRQRRDTAPSTCRGTKARRSCTTSSTCTSPPTATWSTSASRCSTSCARSRTSTTTTAGTAAWSPAAC